MCCQCIQHGGLFTPAVNCNVMDHASHPGFKMHSSFQDEQQLMAAICGTCRCYRSIGSPLASSIEALQTQEALYNSNKCWVEQQHGSQTLHIWKFRMLFGFRLRCQCVRTHHHVTDQQVGIPKAVTAVCMSLINNISASTTCAVSIRLLFHAFAWWQCQD